MQTTVHADLVCLAFGRRRISVAGLISILLLPALPRLCCRRLERLLEVGEDVVDVLGADRDADEVLDKHRQHCMRRPASSILTSVTPLLIFSSSLSCSCVVVHG